MKMLYGSQNFGYETKFSDRDWLEFTYPTLDDIILHKRTSIEHKNEDGSCTKIKDIRLILLMIEKGNFNDLQILYSKEMYNCDDLKWFIDNRDRLVRSNLYQVYSTNRGYLKSCLSRNTRKDTVRALCFNELLKRVFSEETFDMYVDGLGKYILDDSLNIDTDKLLEKSKQYEEKALASKVDTSILERAREEVKRLLKVHLLEEFGEVRKW